MQVKNLRATVAPPPFLPRTFSYGINTLFVHTKVMANNLVSLHLNLAGHAKMDDKTPLFLSEFQLELTGQAAALQRLSVTLVGKNLPPHEWRNYAELWRFADVSNMPASLYRLKKATDQLEGLYESLLPYAAAQSDQAMSFYLLAEHLIALDGYCRQLERSNRVG